MQNIMDTENNSIQRISNIVTKKDCIFQAAEFAEAYKIRNRNAETLLKKRIAGAETFLTKLVEAFVSIDPE
ncbi:MAG: hypothetical protein AB1798_16960, partial [Spirochaetota bacterium]